HSAVKFPASFMLVCAMNPTPKGDMPTSEVGKRAMDQYLSRLSGPLIDRIDIHVEAPAVPWKQLSAAPRGTSSAPMRGGGPAARRAADKAAGPADAQLAAVGPATRPVRGDGRHRADGAGPGDDRTGPLGPGLRQDPPRGPLDRGPGRERAGHEPARRRGG